MRTDVKVELMLSLSLFQKDKPYLQRTSQSLVKDRVELKDSREHNKQKRVVPSLLDATAMP